MPSDCQHVSAQRSTAKVSISKILSSTRRLPAIILLTEFYLATSYEEFLLVLDRQFKGTQTQFITSAIREDPSLRFSYKIYNNI